MKIFVGFLLCMLLCGCSGGGLREIPVATPVQTVPLPQQSGALADTQDCAFRVDGCHLEENGDYTVKLVCENRGSASQLFSCEDWCIDGWQVLPFWGEEVAPGGEMPFQVTIPALTLKKSGIVSPQSLSFDLRIFSQANLNQNYLVSTRCMLYLGGARPGHLTVPPIQWQTDAMVLVDNNGCTMVITDFHQEERGYQVDCLLENKTRSPLLYRVYGLAFNGQESDQVWTLHLSPGAKCAVTMDLELPPATGYVRDLALSLYVSQNDQWFGKVWAQERFSLQPPWKPK